MIRRLMPTLMLSAGVLAAQALPAAAAGAPYGAIGAKYYALGGPASFLGQPLTDETSGAFGGRLVHFQGGSIYWTPATGAHEVHGAIRGTWAGLGWEYSPVHYPTSDEQRLPTGTGAASFFQGGAIYWSPGTGAHEVYGAIVVKYQQTGWETGLGFPVTGEFAIPGGRESNFEAGYITWTPASGAVVHVPSFPNCDSMRTVYPHGAGEPAAVDRTSGTPPVTTFLRNHLLYLANTTLDRDHDGIACEQL